jgi:preprotein translocase subunit YajC
MYWLFNHLTFLVGLMDCSGGQQAAQQASQQTTDAGCMGGLFGGNTYSTIMLIALPVLMIVLFLVMSIPQRKREKKVKEMLDSLKPGDRVRTIGGIYGTVTSVKDDVVTMSTGPDKIRLVLARGAISTIEDAPVEATIDGDVKEVKK